MGSLRGAVTEPAILLVTCCLELSRYEILKQVMANVREKCPPEWAHQVTVFDNASTYVGGGELLSTFSNVYRSDRNVGYWTAIDWWLEQLEASHNPPLYTYIIESDMIHYAAHRVADGVKFLNNNPHLGAVRLHEYSIENFRFYNKDAPIPGSRKNLWQSHTNKVTGEGIKHQQVDGPFWKTNFLTQLPALNRYQPMKRVFDGLHECQKFTELDFQRLYHASFPEIAIADGGAFNCDLNPYGSGKVTGSWTDPGELKRLGYQSTRFASIVPRGQYTVSKL
jgi:hypothetical protein